VEALEEGPSIMLQKRDREERREERRGERRREREREGPEGEEVEPVEVAAAEEATP
jgi:hypothetical protein